MSALVNSDNITYDNMTNKNDLIAMKSRVHLLMRFANYITDVNLCSMLQRIFISIVMKLRYRRILFFFITNLYKSPSLNK